MIRNLALILTVWEVRQDFKQGRMRSESMLINSPGQVDKEKNDILSLDCLSLWLSIASLTMVAQMVKNLPAVQEAWLRSLCWEDPLEKGMAIHFSIFSGESHGQRCLAGCSPWGHKARHN